MVVERVGAELAQPVVVGGRGGGDHVRAAADREPDRHVADAARRPADQQLLAAADAERLERLVGGQAGERERGGLLPAEAPSGLWATNASGTDVSSP